MAVQLEEPFARAVNPEHARALERKLTDFVTWYDRFLAGTIAGQTYRPGEASIFPYVLAGVRADLGKGQGGDPSYSPLHNTPCHPDSYSADLMPAALELCAISAALKLCNTGSTAALFSTLRAVQYFRGRFPTQLQEAQNTLAGALGRPPEQVSNDSFGMEVVRAALLAVISIRDRRVDPVLRDLHSERGLLPVAGTTYAELLAIAPRGLSAAAPKGG